MRIRAYLPQDAAFHPYDPGIEKIAALLRDTIRGVEPRLEIEHIGSTSIPGCGGKGILDLAILYPDGLLARAREVLDGLGFQKQGGPEPFPEDRPMRVGRLEHRKRSCLVHAHVIPRDCREHRELVWFRDRLRRGPALRRRYEDRKRAILAMGIRDSIEYCKAKGPFIVRVLKERPARARSTGRLCPAPTGRQ